MSLWQVANMETKGQEKESELHRHENRDIRANSL